MVGKVGDEHMRRWPIWPGGLLGGGRLKKTRKKRKKTWFINLGFFYLLGGVNRGNDFFETQFLHL